MGKLKTHEQYLQEMNKIHPNIEVVGKYINSSTYVDLYCLTCGHNWKSTPDNSLGKHPRGCPKCGITKKANGQRNSQEVFINRMKICNPNIRVDGKYINTHTKVDCTCLLCGSKIQINPKRTYPLPGNVKCLVCSDGISFPNKFVRAFIQQLPVQNIQYEYIPDWGNGKIYDCKFCYNNHTYIIEADGIQHYKYIELMERNGSVKNTDELKNKLAYENNAILIRINCSESTMNYIKNSILMSDLSNLFNLSNIDWEKCAKIASSSIMYEIIDKYNLGMSTTQIKEILNLSLGAIIRYLKKGTELNLCDYIPYKTNKTIC